MVARWLSVIDMFDIDIQHRSGNKHTNADSLSRITPRKCKRDPCPSCYPVEVGCIHSSDRRKDSNLSVVVNPVITETLVMVPKGR